MTVYLVGAGPGDPDLLTVKAARILSRADLVIHDRLIDPRVFELVPPHTERIDVGKRPGWSATQNNINELLVTVGAGGGTERNIVRLKGGDPFVFGRGGEEAEALMAAGVLFEVVPGISAALAGPAAAGIPVTHRGLSASVTVVAGHREGHDDTNWDALAVGNGTIVVLMGVEHRQRIAAALLAGGRLPSTPVAVIERATWESQRTIRTTLAQLGGVDVVSPAIIVIGDVAALSYVGVDAQLLSTTVISTE
jgi:uroporphyrin-III C-methyltransferase